MTVCQSCQATGAAALDGESQDLSKSQHREMSPHTDSQTITIFLNTEGQLKRATGGGERCEKE